MKDLEEELSYSNDLEIIEKRRFVKQNDWRDASPVLITILGSSLPDTNKVWFTRTRIQLFVDRLRQCSECFSFLHPTRVCEKSPIYASCGIPHSSVCVNSEKCNNCGGQQKSTSQSYPFFKREQ
ncbi:hypothetical protein AVEN_122785-1 [Araneus ventricosus]|uniref:Uncharacterized protein n=1 Tax=Araneus ventricosus TaxID=182803 RepID=A0A4Y2MBJ7_ARAVE|nr:hypothetical protein AVEN_122785-1 [Araneus ventricosus]